MYEKSNDFLHTKFKNFVVPRKFIKFSRKSQMEILGLAIFVVLILIATFFVIRFLVFKSPEDYRKGFLSSELASGMINVLLRVNNNLCSLSMVDLVRNCAESNNICCDNCGTGNDVYSCEFVEKSVKSIFAKSLDEWKYKYEFLVYQDANNPKIRIGEKCRGEKKSESYSIPSNSNTIYLKLDICS